MKFQNKIGSNNNGQQKNGILPLEINKKNIPGAYDSKRCLYDYK